MRMVVHPEIVFLLFIIYCAILSMASHNTITNYMFDIKSVVGEQTLLGVTGPKDLIGFELVA